MKDRARGTCWALVDESRSRINSAGRNFDRRGQVGDGAHYRTCSFRQVRAGGAPEVLQWKGQRGVLLARSHEIDTYPLDIARSDFTKEVIPWQWSLMKRMYQAPRGPVVVSSRPPPGTFLHRQGRAQDLEARRVKNGTHDGMLRPCLPLVSFMGWEPMASLTSSRGDGPPEKTAGPRGRPANFAPEKKNRGGAMR